MVVPLAILCALEFALAIVLAFALFAATPASAAAPADAPSAAPLTTSSSTAVPNRIDKATERPATEPLHPGASDARTIAVPRVRSDDPVGVLLVGTVRWRDGGPVVEPRIYASSGGENRSADSGKDGSYAMPRLAPGTWTMHLAAEGAADSEVDIAIGDDAVQERDFLLDRSFPLRVLIVTPDGQDATRAARMALRSLHNFHVVGQKERFPDRLAPTDYGVVFVGDAKWDPEMNPENGFAGTLSLAQSPPAWAALLLRNLVLEQQIVQPDQKEVRFVVDLDALKTRLGSASVRIVDANTGAPIEGANVGLNTSNSGMFGPKTDADGRISFADLMPGLLQFTVSSTGHESVYQVVRIDAGQHLDLGEVRLGAPANLKGRVLDADGKPATATVTWTDLKWRTAPTGFAHNRVARVEADGTFELWGTGAGAIAVTARSGDGRIAAIVVDNPPPQPVELRLVPAAQCTVTRPSDPTRAFVVTLYDDRRRAVAAMALEPRSTQHELRMPPGTYAFTVHDDHGCLLQEGTLQFGALPCTLEVR